MQGKQRKKGSEKNSDFVFKGYLSFFLKKEIVQENIFLGDFSTKSVLKIYFQHKSVIWGQFE